MSELATEIEAGGGTDEAVALALGWVIAEDFGYSLTDYECEWQPAPLKEPWKVAPPERARFKPKPPAFLTDLNALAAECERRGLDWFRWRIADSEPINPGKMKAQVYRRDGRWLPSNNGTGSVFATADDFARALCAALIRAVESEAAAIRGDAK